MERALSVEGMTLKQIYSFISDERESLTEFFSDFTIESIRPGYLNRSEGMEDLCVCISILEDFPQIVSYKEISVRIYFADTLLT